MRRDAGRPRSTSPPHCSQRVFNSGELGLSNMPLPKSTTSASTSFQLPYVMSFSFCTTKEALATSKFVYIRAIILSSTSSMRCVWTMDKPRIAQKRMATCMTRLVLFPLPDAKMGL